MQKISITIFTIISLSLTTLTAIGQKEKNSTEVSIISEWMQECLEEISKNVIYKVAYGGGYYSRTDLSTKEHGFAYYKIGNKTYIPALKDINKEIGRRISEGLVQCTDFLKNDPVYKIIAGNVRPKVAISDTIIKISVRYPIDIMIGNSSYTIKNFETEITIPFGRIYKAATEYIKKELIISSGGICITCLLDVANEYDVYTDIFKLENNDVALVFIDKIGYDKGTGDPLKFVFANKYIKERHK